MGSYLCCRPHKMTSEWGPRGGGGEEEAAGHFLFQPAKGRVPKGHGMLLSCRPFCLQRGDARIMQCAN